MKKVIAITQRIEFNEKYSEIRESLDVNYLKLLKESGYIPVLLSYTFDIDDIMKRFNIDGVLLSGGNDLNICNENRCSLLRDEFEKKLISYCIDKDIPVFGICRGLQIIGNYFNSSFIAVEGQISIKHELLVNPKSHYYEVLKKLKSVNAYHNYGIKNLSSNLLCSATTTDGLIKAIEHKKYKIFAQMWHTERETPFEIEQIDIIKKIFG